MSSESRLCPNCSHQVPRASFRCPSCKELMPSMMASPTGAVKLHTAAAGAGSFSVAARGSASLNPAGEVHTFASLIGNMTSTEGRIGRLEHFVSTMLLYGTSLLLMVLAGLLGVALGALVLGIGLVVSIALAMIVMGVIVEVKRLHDLGRPGWQVVALWVPILNIIALLGLFLLPGNPGPNEYGEDPTQRAIPMHFVWISIVLFSLSLLAQCLHD